MTEHGSPEDQTPPTNRFGTPVPAPDQFALANPYAPPSPYATPLGSGYPPYGPPPGSVLPRQIPAAPPGGSAVRTWLIVGAAVLPALLVLSVLAAVVAPGHLGRGRSATTQPPSSAGGGSTGSAGSLVPLPAVLTAKAPKAGNLVTPRAAKAIAAAAWSVREAAMAARSVPSLRRLESGPALAGDEVRLCGCGPADGPVTATAVFVARQQHYPATFMARVEMQGTTDPYQVDYVVLRRESSASPWQIVFNSAAYYKSTPALYDADDDAEGYAAVPTPAEQATAALQPHRLAAYWQHAKDTGKAGSPGSFTPGYWTDQKARGLATYRNDGRQPGGIHASVYFTVDDADRVYTTRIASNTFACGEIHRRIVDRSQGLSLLFQNPDRSNWGPAVPPGDYHQIVSTGVAQTCFAIPDSGVGYTVDVIGGSESLETTAVSYRR
jgi:hypothetical protein